MPPVVLAMALRRLRCLAGILAAGVLAGNAGVAAAQEPPLVADGVVRAAVADGTRVYVGGTFDYIGPSTGPAQVVDAGTAARLGAPRFDGPVLAAVSDGAGGWFVGGEFTHVAGIARGSLVHLLADGSVDPNWSPAVTGAVLALARWEGTLYVGGNFSSVGGRSRNRIAAVNTASGAVMPGFDPDVGFDGVPLAPQPPRVPPPVVGEGPDFEGGAERLRRALDVRDSCFDPTFDLRARNELRGVEAIAADGARVYIGGSFTSVSGVERQHLAALDATTGEVDDTFDPDASTPGRHPRALSRRAETNGPVNALALVGDRLYAGGEFTSAVGRSRARLAAFATGDGALVPGFDPAVDGTVRALATAGERLYVGGSFRSIAGALRRNVASVDLTTGAADRGFSARVAGTVDALAAAGDRLYTAGRFQTVAGVPRARVAALSLASGALVRGFEANADARAAALAAAGGQVFVGGFFASIGGLVRHGLAVLDTRPGSASRRLGQPVRGFEPGVPMTAKALALRGRRLYVSGFPDGSGRGRVVALDRTTGAAATRFRPPRGAPDRLLAAGTRLYVGGSGRVVAGADGPLAALDLRSGRRDRGFAPVYRGAVGALASAGPGVYAGGALFTPRELRRARRQDRFARSIPLVELRPDGSRIRAFRPRLEPRGRAAVFALARTGTRLYASGFFRTAGRVSQRNLAAFDPQSGAPIRAFDPPGLSATVLELAGERLFVNSARTGRHVTVLDAGSGARRRSIALAGSACALAATPDALVVGGGFRSLARRPSENLGLIALP